jgi:hypothetical protein
MSLFGGISSLFSGKGFNIKNSLLTGGLMPVGTNKMLDPAGIFKKPDKALVTTVDPAKEQKDAENKAAALANSKAAQRRRSQTSGSLLSTGAAGSTAPAQTQSILAYGKSKLGQ